MKTSSLSFVVMALAIVCGSATPAAAQFDYRAIAAAHQGSLTSPRLRSDTTARIRGAILGMDACPAISVRSMRVTAFTNAHAAWRERWIVADCKRTRPVSILFTPTPDGGADFAVSMKR